MPLTLDAFREEVKNSAPGPKCGIYKVRKKLKKADDAALLAAIADEGITSMAISTVLKRNGHSVSHYTITRHRRGECSCES